MGLRTQDIDTAATGAIPAPHATSHLPGNGDPVNLQLEDLANVNPASASQGLGSNCLLKTSDGVNWSRSLDVPKSLAGRRFYLSVALITPSSAQNNTQIATIKTTPTIGSGNAVAISPNAGDAGIAFLYDTPLGLTSIPTGIWVINPWLSGGIFGDGSDSVLFQAYSVLTQDGAAITVTTTGTGTSRTVTASGGTPFSTSKITATGDQASSQLQTSAGIYPITARTSDTVVTIRVPTGYVNQSNVVFNVWSKIMQFPNVASVSANSVSLYSLVGAKPTIPLVSAHKLGIIAFTAAYAGRSLFSDAEAENSFFEMPATSPPTALSEIAGLGPNVAAFLAAPSVSTLRTAITQFPPATVLRLAQTTSLTPAVNTLCKVSLYSANKSVQLPASHVAGDVIKVKMTSPAGGKHITVNPHGIQTVDGALTRILSSDWAAITLESDGTNWLITG